MILCDCVVFCLLVCVLCLDAVCECFFVFLCVSVVSCVFVFVCV